MILEAGLVDFYKYGTWSRMKQEFLDSDEEKIKFVERPDISALNMDDLQGTFYLAGLAHAFALLLFVIEFCFGFSAMRNSKAAKVI